MCFHLTLAWAQGLLKPLVSPIYTFCTKSKVTGTDINFTRNHNFRGLLVVEAHSLVAGHEITSSCASGQATWGGRGAWWGGMRGDGRLFSVIVGAFELLYARHQPPLAWALACLARAWAAQHPPLPYIYILHKKLSDRNRH